MALILFGAKIVAKMQPKTNRKEKSQDYNTAGGEQQINPA
jgi:hypothetical protein